MEFALPDLLSREDILKILNQRQLHINNINELTHEELLKVYKTFVMPLSRRPERSKRNREKCNVLMYKNRDSEGQHLYVDTLDTSCNAMDIDFVCVETCNVGYIESNYTINGLMGEKRRQRSIDEDNDACKNDYQYQLTSVTKRIRINSLS